MPFASAGTHQITVRTQSSSASNAFILIVGSHTLESASSAPLADCAPQMYAVENNLDGTTVFHGHRNEVLCCYFTLAGTSLQKADIVVEAGSIPLPADFLTDLSGSKWQANSRLPAALADGSQPVRVRVAGGGFSNAMQIDVRRSADSD